MLQTGKSGGTCAPSFGIEEVQNIAHGLSVCLGALPLSTGSAALYCIHPAVHSTPIKWLDSRMADAAMKNTPLQ